MDYDDIAEDYGALYLDRMSKAEDDVVYDLVERFARPSILDVGCSIGNVLDRIDYAPGCYDGVDISPSMIREARWRHPKHQFFCQDFVNWPFGGYGTVLSLYGTGNHIADLTGYFKAVARALRPGGRYFGMFYTQKHLTNPRYTFNQTGGSAPVFIYSPKEIAMSMEETGLRCERMRSFGVRHGDRLPRAVLRTTIKGTTLFPATVRTGEHLIVWGSKDGPGL